MRISKRRNGKATSLVYTIQETRLREASNPMRGRQAIKNALVRRLYRAMPETEISPCFAGDIYFRLQQGNPPVERGASKNLGK